MDRTSKNKCINSEYNGEKKKSRFEKTQERMKKTCRVIRVTINYYLLSLENKSKNTKEK